MKQDTMKRKTQKSEPPGTRSNAKRRQRFCRIVDLPVEAKGGSVPVRGRQEGLERVIPEGRARGAVHDGSPTRHGHTHGNRHRVRRRRIPAPAPALTGAPVLLSRGLRQGGGNRYSKPRLTKSRNVSTSRYTSTPQTHRRKARLEKHRNRITSPLTCHPLTGSLQPSTNSRSTRVV